MLRFSLRRLLSVFVLLCLAVPGADRGRLEAQSLSEAQVGGTVRTALGELVPRALITLFDDAGVQLRSVDGGLNGTFVVRGLGPGVYRLRVEALGFSAKEYEGLQLRPGAFVRLAVVLAPAGSPVEVVAAAGMGQQAAAGRWVDAPALQSLPRETPGLEAWSTLSTLVGDDMGMEGLPGQFTRLSIDGIPFRPVRPLGQRGLDRAGGVFTGRTLSTFEIAADPSSLGVRAGAGGHLAAFSQRSGAASFSLDGAGSAGGLRSAATDPDDAPSATSIWGGGLASIVLSPDTSGLVLGADVWQVERPRGGLFPDAGGDVEGVGVPYVEQRRGFAGFARLDRVLSRGGAFWGAGRIAVQPGTTDLTGMAYGLGDAGERVDALVGLGLITPVGSDQTLEARVGVSRSAWTAATGAGVDLPFDAGAPTFFDASTGLRAGPGGVGIESASRLDLDVGGNLLLERGEHSITIGIQGGVAAHVQTLPTDAQAELFVGSGSPTSAWQGAVEARRFRGEVTGSVPRVAAYIEDTWQAGPGLTLEGGIRFDSEWVPISNVRPGVNWFQQTGLPTPTLVEQVGQPGGFLGLNWQGAGGTQLTLRGSYLSDEFDPLLMTELQVSQEYDDIRTTGSFQGWPAVPPAASSPSRIRSGLAYLRNDPEAPVSLRVTAALDHTTASGTGLGVAAIMRRTDGLVRRRDLNRSAAPRGVDAGGRDLWGQPLQVGAWLGATPGTLSRFDDFGPVWELDQGGWSEYVGVTGRLSHQLPSGLSVMAEYTWSRTEDNVPGIGSAGLIQGVSLEALSGDDATTGRSDLDRPHRAVATLSFPLPVGEGSAISGVYRFESGAPFTPGYMAGVDANMDGVRGNDPAFVSSAADSEFGSDWACLRGDAGGFAERNSCRAPDVHSFDLRLSIALPAAGVDLFVDGLNLLDQERSILDTALLRVDPAATVQGSGTTTRLPFTTNESFGMPLRDLSPGRVLRVGLRVGR